MKNISTISAIEARSLVSAVWEPELLFGSLAIPFIDDIILLLRSETFVIRETAQETTREWFTQQEVEINNEIPLIFKFYLCKSFIDQYFSSGSPQSV